MTSWLDHAEADGLGFRKAIRDVSQAVGKATGKASVDVLLPETGSVLVRALIGDVAGAVGGSLVDVLLRLWLRESDKIAVRLDRLLAASLQTGSRMINDATMLSANTQASAHFRDKLLGDGLAELERAWTYATGTGTQDEDQFYIRLMQALAASLMSGGSEYARRRIEECIATLESEMQQATVRMHALERAIEQGESAASRHKAVSDASRNSVGAGGFASMHHHQRYEALKASAAQAAATREKLQQAVDEWGVFTQVLRVAANQAVMGPT
jgi:hypothetical protein